MVRRVLMLMALSLAAPSAAHAATVQSSGGVLTYSAAPATITNITVVQSGSSVTITRITGDDDALLHVGGCAPATDTAITCPDVVRVEIDTGDRADRVTATALATLPAIVSAGDGNDVVNTGFGNDTVDGGAGDDTIDAGPGNDVLRGGDGNDNLLPNTGTDGISGGDGIDTVTFGKRVSPSYSLDGLANDGESGENDLIGVDVENANGAAEPGVVTLTGDGRANHLEVTGGPGVITGGEGADVLEGGPANDVINARDSSPDTVICAGGVDTVLADTLDLISPSCENVSIQASPGGPFDDRAPTIAWAAPAAGASLAANDPTTLRVDASDDRGLAKVQFLDDERVVCEDVAAPYECAYQPRGGDVGRNTLIAIAVDTAGQTTSLVRPVTVRRFTSPSLTLTLRPSRDRRAPYTFRAGGTLRRPATVTAAEGCSGRVVITAKRGKRKVSTTRTSLTRSCRFAKTVRFRKKVGSRIRLTAKFEGNDVIASRTSSRRTARLG